jgi:hypothetical protein
MHLAQPGGFWTDKTSAYGIFFISLDGFDPLRRRIDFDSDPTAGFAEWAGSIVRSERSVSGD